MSLSCQALCLYSERCSAFQSLFQKCPVFGSCVSVQGVFVVFNSGHYCFALKHGVVTGYLPSRESPQAGYSIHTSLFKLLPWGPRALYRIFLLGITPFKTEQLNQALLCQLIWDRTLCVQNSPRCIKLCTFTV